MTVTHVTGASSCLVIPDSAHQPVVKFPVRTYGKQQRAFCSSWYSKYPWLQEAEDSVLCFYCLVAEKRGLKSSGVVRNVEFYGSDFHAERLETQLTVLHNYIKQKYTAFGRIS
jgi:hypothetical protein